MYILGCKYVKKAVGKKMIKTIKTVRIYKDENVVVSSSNIYIYIYIYIYKCTFIRIHRF